MHKKAVYAIASLSFFLATPFATLAQVRASAAVPGDLVKASQPAVYYFGSDGKRYVFPNEKTYFTWFSDFNSVKVISDAELGAIQIGGNVTYKPGSRLLKITTDPKVYWVDMAGTLRAIGSEAVAIQLFGSAWNKKVDDLPDAFFINYKVGTTLITPTLPTLPANLSIAMDKGLASPAPLPSKPQTFNVDIKDFTFTPSVLNIKKGDTVVWTNSDTAAHQVASNPHPAHTEHPELNSPVLSTGGTFSVTLTQSGTYNYHCHLHPSMSGQIIVE